MQKASEIFEIIKNRAKNIEFMATGFPRLDESLDGGFIHKELVVIGGFTGIGKSFIAGQLLWNIAQQGFNSAYFSLEIANTTVISRIVGSLAKIKPTRIIAGLLNQEEFDNKEHIQSTIQAYDKLMTFYDDIYDLDTIHDEIMKNHYEFVIVDFIQNIMVGGLSEYDRMSKAAVELQKLAKKFNCVIVVLSQISNRIGSEKGEIAQIEYKGAGTIAQVCDLGFLIQKSTVTPTDLYRYFTLGLMKNRRGVSGIKFDYRFEYPGGLINEI